MALEMPPRRALGDIAVPVAFALARRLRKAPRAIAQELAAALGPIDGVARVEAAPNGYLNLFLDRAHWTAAVAGGSFRLKADAGLQARADEDASSSTRRSIRTRRPISATCGTRRSATPSAGCSASRGAPVEIQNYIDDTGVQVADVVVGFRELEGKSLAEVRAIADSTRFDYYCWDLYARVTEWYARTPTPQAAAEDPHAPRCTTSSTAATTPPTSPPSSPNASSART